MRSKSIRLDRLAQRLSLFHGGKPERGSNYEGQVCPAKFHLVRCNVSPPVARKENDHLNPRLHDTTCCQTGCQTGLITGMTTGCIVYANIQPVVKPV